MIQILMGLNSNQPCLLLENEVKEYETLSGVSYNSIESERSMDGWIFLSLSLSLSLSLNIYIERK